MQNTFSDATEHVQQRFAAAAINTDPFPTITIDNIFPDRLYQQILENKIADDCLQTLYELRRVPSDVYRDRKVKALAPKMFDLSNSQRQFWEPFGLWMATYFKQTVLEKFADLIVKRFADTVPKIQAETLYTRDRSGYKLGPHTDSTSKVITLLIYLPRDAANPGLGTSIYQHRDPGFTCAGGPHYQVQDFHKIATAEYVPNRLFGFFKTNNSFHGVEPLGGDLTRDLLIYDLQVKPTGVS